MNLWRGAFRIGRIFGIDILIDWSWIVIFALVTWSLAMGIFPSWHPGWPPGLSWGIAVAASLLFFASILLHELAHSLVAKARGMPVRRIVLFLLGGVSNIEREPPSPGVEFVMAAVGPLTSIALGVIFSFAGIESAGGAKAVLNETAYTVRRMSPGSTLLLWLGPINILIGLFNLIPGFPLDGGRLLRSALWAATGKLNKATIWASQVGRAIAWLFILTGVAMVFGFRVPLLGTGIFSGLWLAFIGWFLHNAAVASRRQVLIEDLLGDLPVSRLMRAEFHSVSPDLNVEILVHDWIMKTDTHAFMVVENDRTVGLVCMGDVRKLPREEWSSRMVAAIMTPADRLVTAGPEEHVSDALRRMSSRDVRQLPVVEDGRPLGMLLLEDISKYLRVHRNI